MFSWLASLRLSCRKTKLTALSDAAKGRKKRGQQIRGGKSEFATRYGRYDGHRTGAVALWALSGLYGSMAVHGYGCTGVVGYNTYHHTDLTDAGLGGAVTVVATMAEEMMMMVVVTVQIDAETG